MELQIASEDPSAEDVRDLLATHLALARASTPIEYSFALDADELSQPGLSLFGARENGRLVGVAALKHIDSHLAELKSMHTQRAHRGRGVGRALVEHVLAFAKSQGYRHVGLETGTGDEFIAARALYARCGFSPCGPFAGYSASAYNTFMTISLSERPPDSPPT